MRPEAESTFSLSLSLYCFHHLLQYILYITYFYFVDTKQVMRGPIENQKNE